MKRLLCVLIGLSAAMYAQAPNHQGSKSQAPTAQATQHNVAISRSDIYCSGYIGSSLPHSQFVAGGLHSPNTTRFVDHDYIYLRGSGYQPGTRVSLIRELQDPNRYTPIKGGKSLLTGLGQLYGDLGYATVLEIRGHDTAVAQVEFSCQDIVPGDLVVPFVERSVPPERPRSTFDRFPAGAPKLKARIVAARDFDQFPASSGKVYLNVGDNKGVQAGDYLFVTRGYSAEEMDVADEVSLHATYMEDTQKNPPHLPTTSLKDLPRRIVGELIVLSTHKNTATAMVISTFEEIHVGDAVELQ